MVASEVEASIASTQSQTKSSDMGSVKDIPESHIAHENEIIVPRRDPHEFLFVDSLKLLSCRWGRGSAVCTENDTEWDLIARGVGAGRVGQCLGGADFECIVRGTDSARTLPTVHVVSSYSRLELNV